MSADDDVLDAIDTAAQLQSSRLSGDLLVTTEIGMGH